MKDIKVCKRCELEKNCSAFYRDSQNVDRKNSRCIECCLALNKENYYRRKAEGVLSRYHQKKKEDPDGTFLYHREKHLKKKFGITEADYLDLLEEQMYCCKICNKHESENSANRNLAVDHNHETGEIRGLLCDPCNRGLGLFKDNPLVMQKALDYLKDEGHYGS